MSNRQGVQTTTTLVKVDTDRGRSASTRQRGVGTIVDGVRDEGDDEVRRVGFVSSVRGLSINNRQLATPSLAKSSHELQNSTYSGVELDDVVGGREVATQELVLRHRVAVGEGPLDEDVEEFGLLARRSRVVLHGKLLRK